MKRIRLYVTAVVLAVAGMMAMSAGAQVLRDADFNSIGRINGNGVVRDATGRSAGSFDADGTVRDGESNVLGNISINDGKVTDAAKQTIGFARGVRVDWIACYYFFHFFKK